MMQRTATVQGNFDWSSEADGMKKLVVALKLSPLLHAWFVNAPFLEGKKATGLSQRGHVWRRMDPTRSGLIASLWDKKQATYDDYVEWTLDAGMFLIRREGEILKNTGQSFRDFLAHGFEGHQATAADYQLHLTTLFPEVRLKNTLEVRSVDSVPPELAVAVLAVWTGLLYDEQALDEAHALVESFRFQEAETQRPELIERGLHASWFGKLGFEWAERLLEIATGGLTRRDRLDDKGHSETPYLAPAEEIRPSRGLPAERVLERWQKSGSLVEATRLRLPD
jgi:glutamate--cysteine ligase